MKKINGAPPSPFIAGKVDKYPMSVRFSECAKKTPSELAEAMIIPPFEKSPLLFSASTQTDDGRVILLLSSAGASTRRQLTKSRLLKSDNPNVPSNASDFGFVRT